MCLGCWNSFEAIAPVKTGALKTHETNPANGIGIAFYFKPTPGSDSHIVCRKAVNPINFPRTRYVDQFVGECEAFSRSVKKYDFLHSYGYVGCSTEKFKVDRAPNHRICVLNHHSKILSCTKSSLNLRRSKRKGRFNVIIFECFNL